MSADPNTGLAFESVLFRDRYVEVSFTEERDRGNGIARVQTMVVDPTKLPSEYGDLIDSLVAFVDAASVALRNPPERIPG